MLFISNHISDADGVTLMIVAHRAGALGLLRFVAKRAIQFVFPPGTLMRIHDMLFLSRRFEDDETNIRRYLDSFREHGGRLWLWIFPEGTYITPQRARTFEESRAFAQSKGMPPLNNLLMPRVKGMQMIVQGLAGHLDAVYDVTIAYTGPFDTRLGARWPPSFMAHMHGTLHSLNDEEDDDGGANALPGPRGEKPALHIHLRRFSREEVQGADLEKWLFKTWQRKGASLRAQAHTCIFALTLGRVRPPSRADKEGLLETFRLRRSFPGAQRHDALPATQWQLELALSCLPPLLVAYHLLRLFVAHKGGLVAALPALLSGSLVVAAATGAFLLFMSKQGRAKAPRARTQRQ